jgi:hypothetical protein
MAKSAYEHKLKAAQNIESKETESWHESYVICIENSASAESGIAWRRSISMAKMQPAKAAWRLAKGEIMAGIG